MSENYGVKDIKTLEGIEAIRLRAGIFIAIHLLDKCSFHRFVPELVRNVKFIFVNFYDIIER